jgi:nitroreductase
MDPFSQRSPVVPASNCTAADLIRFLRRANQTRDFLPDPVPDAVVDDILEVARWTGSSMNRQKWMFYAVRDREKIRRIGEIAAHGPHLGKAGLVVVIAMSGEHVEFDASDEGRAAERIILAAAAHGLGAGIAWFRPEERDAMRDLLGVPAGWLVRTGLAIGRVDESKHVPKPKGTARKPIEEVTRRFD